MGSLAPAPFGGRNWKQKCAAVIPCFNEAPRIGEVVKSVLKFIPTVIVVDDGSTDLTAESAAAAGAQIIRLISNQGKGAALRFGWQHAYEAGFKWALTLDGDGQHAGEDAAKFLECADKTNAPLIVGNRMKEAHAIPWLRRMVNQWMSRRLSRFTRAPLADSQCGFRLVNLDALAAIPLTTERFEIESEMLVKFLQAGHRVEFVPIRVIYKTEQSKIHPVFDTWRWLRWRFSQSKDSACVERSRKNTLCQ